jgi:hypothetical protein
MAPVELEAFSCCNEERHGEICRKSCIENRAYDKVTKHLEAVRYPETVSSNSRDKSNDSAIFTYGVMLPLYQQFE